MRLLRWGAELAADERQGRRLMGLAALRGLSYSPLLDPDDLGLVDSALTTAHEIHDYAEPEGGAP